MIDGAVSVTLAASIGVAAMPEHGRTAEELLRAADQGAYAAKNAGREYEKLIGDIITMAVARYF